MRSTLSRFLQPATWILVALVLVGAGSFWFALDPGPAAPTTAEWRAAADVIERRAESGDALRIHPFWLREGSVLAEWVGGDRLTLDSSVPMDPMVLYAHPRLWLVSALGRDDAAEPREATILETTQLPGGLRVRLFELPKSPVLASLGERLADAEVTRGPSQGARRACKWNGREHDCNGKPWENVSLQTKEVGGAPRRCFVLHPYPSGATVAVRFPKTRLGAGILVRAGFTLEAAKNEAGSDAVLTVSVGGRVLESRTERKNGWDYVPSFVDTSADAGKVADVVIEVSASNEEFRDLCVDGFVVSRPVPEALDARRCPNPSDSPQPGGC